jgi:hypothetical protein
MPDNDKPRNCPKKDTIDKEAQKALDEIGRIVGTDKKLEMQLQTVKDHLQHIMGDHHR